MNEAFTFDQATTLCKDYQELIGSIVINGENKEFEVIDQIVVAPYGKLLAHIFFKLLVKVKDPVKALAFYDFPQYDVQLIIKELVAYGDCYSTHMDLRTYLKSIGQRFDAHKII